MLIGVCPICKIGVANPKTAVIGYDKSVYHLSCWEKVVNRFVIMCVEQYAAYKEKPSSEIYKLMKEKDIIPELSNDYEDLHGMSTIWLNDYIDKLLDK